MSLQETKMAVMKLAFFFFILSTLLRGYHARPLHDGCVYHSFNGRPSAKTSEIIQMVTGEEEPQLPPPPPLSSSQEQTTYSRDNPNAPPSQGKTDYGGEILAGRPPPRGPSPDGQTNYGRDNPKAPPPPKVAPSRGQTTYGGENPNSNSPTIKGGAGVAKKSLADFVAELIPSYDETIYGRDYLNARTPPRGGPTEGEAVYGRDNPKAPPPPPQVAPSRGAPPSLKPDSAKDRTTYRDDPTTPPIPDPNDPENQGMYGRVDPSVPTPPQPANPTRPILLESKSSLSSGVYL